MAKSSTLFLFLVSTLVLSNTSSSVSKTSLQARFSVSPNTTILTVYSKYYLLKWSLFCRSVLVISTGVDRVSDVALNRIYSIVSYTALLGGLIFLP